MSELPKDQTELSSSMPFLHHLEELRWRLLKSVVAVIVFAGAAFYFAEYIFKFLIIPLGDIKLYVTEVTGSFYAFLKIALFTGIIAALPVIFYQLWAFISPGLFPHEKKAVLPMVAVSTFLFLVGAAFCYYVTLPVSLSFLIGFSGEILNPIITVDSYISFTSILMLAFGFGFQLPVISYFLGKIGILSSAFMIKGRRYAIVIMLIVSAIITPPDVFTQVLMAVPLYILYEISIIIVKATGRQDNPKPEEEAEVETE